ncbi:MAG: hypothetical protein ABWW70_00630 [Thermoproteota archaeon]
MNTKVCIRFLGALAYQVGGERCLELEGCPPLSALLERIARENGAHIDLDTVAAYSGGRAVDLSEPSCRHTEYVVARIARGG